jgi:hypothetical protein
MVTTITVDPKIRDRLKRYGHAGMTYNDILTRLMDEIDEREFVAELRKRAAALREEDWVDLDDA